MLITYSSITIFYFVMLGFVLNSTEIKPVTRNIKVLLVTILLLAFIVRVYAFNKLPNLDLDEAMGGVNTWSLGKYGIDYFHLVKNPVYLYAWGSGMNILYPLITVPFVKVLGLSIVTYRLPLVIISTFSFYYLHMHFIEFDRSVIVSA